ncbi:MAG: hypothetical protein AAGF32_04560 [Pseudomonadota bacterium]
MDDEDRFKRIERRIDDVEQRISVQEAQHHEANLMRRDMHHKIEMVQSRVEDVQKHLDERDLRDEKREEKNDRRLWMILTAVAIVALTRFVQWVIDGGLVL